MIYTLLQTEVKITINSNFLRFSNSMRNQANHSSRVHCCILSLSVRSQSEKSGRAVSPSAAKDSAQTPDPAWAWASASVFHSEAQTRWSNTHWDEAWASVWERRPSSLLPICHPIHVKNPPAPQGGGRTRLRGERYLLSTFFLSSSSFCFPLLSSFAWTFVIVVIAPEKLQ